MKMFLERTERKIQCLATNKRQADLLIQWRGEDEGDCEKLPFREVDNL